LLSSDFWAIQALQLLHKQTCHQKTEAQTNS
jgi:hypothetical protein